MSLRISSEIHDRLLAEAAASPGIEVCGLLVGNGEVERLIVTANVAADPTAHFEIDPAALFTAIRHERAGGERLIGYYHSHPVGPPKPSPRDAAQAIADDHFWLIIGEGRVTAWRVTNANEFSTVDLIIID
jgi:desampylase